MRLFGKLCCPVTDALAAIGTFIGGDAAAAGAVDAIGTGAAEAAGASFGADALAGAGAAGAAGAGAGIAADSLGGAAALDAGAGLSAAGAGAGAGAGAMDIVDIGASALPAAGASGSALPAIGAGVAGAGLGAALPGPTGGTAASPAVADSGSFLPATSSADLSPLTPDVAQSFGVSAPAAPDAATSLPATDASYDPFSDMVDIYGDSTPAASSGGDFTKWLTNPKNAASLGLLGMSGLNALKQPKLPGAAQTALDAAGPGVREAQSVIQSGGTATPIWSQQKSSIDAVIDQQIKQQSEAMMQAAANSGQGDQNSGVVRQQIAEMTANLNEQRQQLYLQAQQQNVNNAIAELSGDNQVLTSIGGMQLAQSEEAQQAAGQTAELALLLQSLKA